MRPRACVRSAAFLLLGEASGHEVERSSSASLELDLDASSQRGDLGIVESRRPTAFRFRLSPTGEKTLSAAGEAEEIRSSARVESRRSTASRRKLSQRAASAGCTEAALARKPPCRRRVVCWRAPSPRRNILVPRGTSVGLVEPGCESLLPGRHARGWARENSQRSPTESHLSSCLRGAWEVLVRRTWVPLVMGSSCVAGCGLS